MSDILIRPQQLRQISEQLSAGAKKISAALQAIDDDIRSLKGDHFLGNRANAVQTHYSPKREALLKAKEIVAHFSEDLQSAATRFEQADQQGGKGLVDNPYSWGEFSADVRDIFRIVAPYTEKEAADYLKTTPAGKSLLNDLVGAKITVELPDGTKIGYEGADGETIKVVKGDSVGGGKYSDNTITISNSILERARSKEDLAALLAHEIQHAYDDEKSGKISLVQKQEINNYFSKTPEEQADIRERLANELEHNNIDSEIRAYERSNSVLDGSDYNDDGVMTANERQSVLDKQLETSRDYEKYYEETFAKSFPGAEFDVSIDSQGEVKIDIKKPEPKDDDWWPFW